MTPAVLVALQALDQGIASCGLRHVVIGGFAVVAHGLGRTTRDIDATLAGDGLDVDRLLLQLSAEGVEARVDAVADFERRTQVLPLVHGPTGVPIDLSLAWLPFELVAIAAGVRMTAMAGSSYRQPPGRKAATFAR